MNRIANPKITIIASSLLILFLSLSSFGQGKKAKPNYLITANSVGDVRLGMTLADARAVLVDGKLIADLTQTRLTRYEAGYSPISVIRGGKLMMSLMTPKFDEQGGEIPVNENSRIAFIKVWDSRYRTTKGVYPGITIYKAERKLGKIIEIFGFYGNDESVEFSDQPRGFEFLVAGKGKSTEDKKTPAGIYENGRDDFADKYTPGAYVLSISISGS